MAGPLFSHPLGRAAAAPAQAEPTPRDEYAPAPAPAAEPFVPELPPATAPHGPRAARTVAQQIADTGAVSCLAADGGHVCLGHPCHLPAPTPAEVLL